MIVIVKSITGRKQKIDISEEDTVLTLKNMLSENEGIPVDQIRLIYKGRQFTDATPISEYNIGSTDTIHMVLNLRGGC